MSFSPVASLKNQLHSPLYTYSDDSGIDCNKVEPLNGLVLQELMMQFFHKWRYFSSHPKERLTIQRLGRTLNVWSSLPFSYHNTSREKMVDFKQALRNQRYWK